MKTVFSLLIVCGLLAMSAFAGTQTENYGIPVLPAPGKIVIDGKFEDWNLTGGVFACNNVEEQRLPLFPPPALCLMSDAAEIAGSMFLLQRIILTATKNERYVEPEKRSLSCLELTKSFG